MFITLQDFFDNYRIKNGKQPNETVLNKGLMRLKREVRELESIIKLFSDIELNPWETTVYYEQDEYVTHNGLNFKSKISNNLNNEPDPVSQTNWEVVTIDSYKVNNGNFKFQQFIATDGQTDFILPFNMDSTPMIWIDGILLDTDRFTQVDNITIRLTNPASLNDVVIITAGVAYETSLLFSKNTFTAAASQSVFTCTFEVKDPSVFVNGLLLSVGDYSYYSNIVELVTPLLGGEEVVIGNGNVLGSDVYVKNEIDTMALDYQLKSDSYTSLEVDTLLGDYTTIIDFNTTIGTINTNKADKATTLSGYGITDAYTKTEVDNALSTKLDTSSYTAADILTKLLTVDGPSSGLNADLLDGLDSVSFVRSDIAFEKENNLTLSANSKQIVFDIEASTPNIRIDSQEVYHTGNTDNVMIIREGYFRGVWDAELDNTFGIINYSDYNWTVSVTPTVTGYEHDYNKDAANGHTPYAGSDITNTWDDGDSEYHYGYVQGNLVRLEAIHRNDSTTIAIPARYHLIGVLKTFSTYAQVNQP